ETRMWTRRLDLNLCEPMANGFRFGKARKFFENRIRVIPEAAEGLIATAQDWVKKLDGWLAGKTYICGERFTMADILVFTWLDFFGDKGQPIDPANKNVVAWHARIKERPSAKA